MATPQSAAKLEPVKQRHGMPGSHRGYLWKNIAITVWFSGPTLESLRSFEQGSRQIIAEHPEGLSSLTILVPGGGMPTAEARRELSRILDTQAPHLAASAVVMRDDGFFASALRGLLTALRMLRRHAIPQQIFSDYEPAAKWLLSLHTARTGAKIDPLELVAALEQIDAACRATPRV